MKDWNVVVSVYQDGFRRARHALNELGPVEQSGYYNVLVMRVENATELLEAVERRTEESTALYDSISRVAPAMLTVEFHSTAEFEEKIETILLEWSSRLAGRSFHVRIHRRGDRHTLSTPEAERLFDDLLLNATAGQALLARFRSWIQML